jgi:hypothetical protein
MNSVKLLAAAAAVAAGMLALSAPAASAAIVCNAENVCWHTHRAYDYDPAWGVVVHEDGWRWGPGDHYTWKEHRGRGYWRNGEWVRF